jgi:hypothetical protein
MLGCGERRQPLSACRSQVVEHAHKYVSQKVPDAQWLPIIEAEVRKCIEEEKPN